MALINFDNDFKIQTKQLICCSNVTDPNWHWLEHCFLSEDLKWQFYQIDPRNFVEKKLKHPDLRYPRAAIEAVKAASRVNKGVFISHGPIISFYTALLGKFFGVSIPQIAYTFNFTVLPKGLRRKLMSLAYQNIDRFVVYSTMERELYSKWFNLPSTKLDVVLWGVAPPLVDNPKVPRIQGRYICAIGEFQRDYAGLMEAMRQLPDIRIVVVARPHNFENIHIPPNVTVLENLPLGETMNILMHSQFMVLPLKGAEIPCGHTTLVYSMHLGIPFITAKSSGVDDYFHEGENGCSYPVGDIPSLVRQIMYLWQNPAQCMSMGVKAQEFASLYCSEDRMAAHFRSYLQEKQIL